MTTDGRKPFQLSLPGPAMRRFVEPWREWPIVITPPFDESPNGPTAAANDWAGWPTTPWPGDA